MRLAQGMPVEQPANRRRTEQRGVSVQDQQVRLITFEQGSQLPHRVPGALRLLLHDIVEPVTQLGAHLLVPITNHHIEIIRRDDLARVGHDVIQDRAVTQFLQQHGLVPLGHFRPAREDNSFQFNLRL